MSYQAKKIFILFISTLFLFISGCVVTNDDYNTPTSYVPAPLPDQAVLTFFWPTGLGDDVTTMIASANPDGKLSLVGTISPGQRIVQNLNAGKYKFVIGGQANQVLEADMQAKKHYYVRIEAQWIALLSGYTFVPISPRMVAAHPDLQIGLMSCSVVTPTNKGEA